MAANGQVSRRRPWPFDASIGSIPVLLKPNESGDLVAQKTRTLDQSSPTSFEYGSADPRKERVFEWSKLYGGLGDSVAPSGRTPQRYFQADFADLSINGLWMKGPDFESHVETIHASAGEVIQFIQAYHGGVLTLFAICTNGVWRRSSDGVWVASLTIGLGGTALGAGMFPQQAVRFKGRFVGAVDCLYLTTATGNLWQYDGAAWTQAAVAEGPGDGVAAGQARFIERVGDELWVAGDYYITKCEANPMLRASWSAVIWIGDQTAKITWLRQLHNALFIFKEDNVYTVSSTGLDQELFAYLRPRRSATNGRNATVWLDEMWVPFAGQTFRLDATGNLTPDGLEQLPGNRSQIKGSMVAGAGHNTWFFYEVYYDNAGHSYLLKHGTWVDQGGGDTVNLQFIDSAHHGSLYSWNKRATGAEILSGIDPTGNDRLYIGFSNGTTEWCILPRTSLDPSQDQNCEFTTKESYVYIPIHHSNFQADNKLYRSISIFGPHLSNGEWAEVQYRIDVVSSTADWVTLDSADPKFTVPGQRRDFPSDNPVYGKYIQLRVLLLKDPDTGISPKFLSPVIQGIYIHEQVRPSISLEYTMTVLAKSFLPKHNGMIDHRRGVTIRDRLLELCAGPGSVEFVFSDGVAQELTIVDYTAVQVPWTSRRDLAYEVTLTAIQLQTITPGTQAAGLTYGTLEQYTYGELEGILS